LDQLETHPGPLLVPVLVITEVAYLASERLGTEAEARFLADFAGAALIIEPLVGDDLLRIVELVWGYRDLRLGTVDASIIAAAERLALRTVATLDRRHFAAVRPRHAEAFDLLP